MERTLVRAVGLFVAAMLLATGYARAAAWTDRATREIGAMLPVVMQAWLGPNGLRAPVRVDGIAVTDDAAVATWDAAGVAMRTDLVYRQARWWVKRTSRASAPADPLFSPFTAEHGSYAQDSDGYVGFIRVPGVAPPKFVASGWFDRAPTDGEMTGPGANGIYYLSRQFAPGESATYPAHATLDVWCPFLLDPELRYSLTIAGGTPFVGPLDGTLRDNILHFDLPAFTAPAGVELQAEIDWLRGRT